MKKPFTKSRNSYGSLGALLAFTLAGCGDPMTDNEYEGDPRISLRGSLKGQLSATDLEDPRVGIAWILGPDSSEFRPGTFTPVSASEFPATFDLNLFDLPPAEVMVPYEDLYSLSEQEADDLIPDNLRGKVSLAYGLIWAIDDVNSDGAFATVRQGFGKIAAPDKIFGMARSIWVIYVGFTETVTAPDGSVLQPGYNLYRVDCDGAEPSTTLLPEDARIDVTLFAPGDDYPSGFDAGLVCSSGPKDPPPTEDEVAIEQSRECQAFCEAIEAKCGSRQCNRKTCSFFSSSSECLEARKAQLACKADNVMCTEDGFSFAGACSRSNELCQ